MEQITYTKTYQEYKAELDTELSRTAEGFVRIGYLLKTARDTDILEQSPYQTVTEFAQAEYGIDKTMVSRFISINDRFSEGGCSDQLREQYKGYGYAKLTLMLTLPDEINNQLSPAYSKAEIQAIKDEVDAEKAITDLEVMMEPPAMPAEPGTSGEKGLLDMLVRQLGEDSPELYVQMAETMALKGAEWIRAARETMAPNGEKQYSIRISGMGRFLVGIRDTEDTITATSLRTMEQHTYGYPALMDAWEKILPPGNGTMDTAWTEEDRMMSWELTYDREYPGKAAVAPVQQPEKTKKMESKPTARKESKVQKAPKPATAKAEPPVKEKQPDPEPEIPENTGTEEVSASKVEFAPGMRVRNKTGKPTYSMGDPCYPQSTATIIGRHFGFDAWDVKWDDIPITRLIYDIDIKEFEVVGQGDQQPEENPQADTSVEEQLPGQIGMEEAIADTEARAAESAGQDNPTTAAGQEPEGEFDTEWEEIKQDFHKIFRKIDKGADREWQTPTIRLKLSGTPVLTIAEYRKKFIAAAALMEKELLRRGVEHF